MQEKLQLARAVPKDTGWAWMSLLGKILVVSTVGVNRFHHERVQAVYKLKNRGLCSVVKQYQRVNERNIRVLPCSHSRLSAVGIIVHVLTRATRTRVSSKLN